MTAVDSDPIVWIDGVDVDTAVKVTGSKMGRLSELHLAGANVPDAFSVATSAYRAHVVASGLDTFASEVVDALGPDPAPDAVERASETIRSEFERRPIGEDLAGQIRAAYQELCLRCVEVNVPVAVRSSATGEDSSDASFAGIFDTYLGFSGEGGHIDAYGVYFTDSGQHQEHRPYVAHTEPHCYSRVTYKGALQGEGAHAVWVGDCLIGQAARGTDTYELNRNLVLTEGAKADSVPNLEIENGNIEGAGHASATGRFDDQQLFYLRARGIPETEARRLVVLGFFNEIVAEIGVDEVEERLMAAIEKELELTGLITARTDQDPATEPAAE